MEMEKKKTLSPSIPGTGNPHGEDISRGPDAQTLQQPEQGNTLASLAYSTPLHTSADPPLQHGPLWQEFWVTAGPLPQQTLVDLDGTRGLAPVLSCPL